MLPVSKMKLTSNDLRRLEERSRAVDCKSRAALDFFVDEVSTQIDAIQNILTMIQLDMNNILKEIDNDET